MAKKFLVGIDLGGNQLLNALVQNAPNNTAPTALGKGQLWYDTTNNQLNVYNGTSFQPLATGGTAVSTLNGFTGGVNIYGTASQVAVTNNTGSITLSLPSTISVTTACATNFYGAFNGNATSATNSTTTSQTNFSALTISGSNVATQAYVTSQGYAALSGANFTGASVGGSRVTTIADNLSVFATGGAISPTSVTTSGDINIGGNLFVTGSTTFVSASTAAIVTDPILYIATGNVANLFDIGIVGHFTSGIYQHTGLVRDHNTNLWRLFSGVTTEPSSSVNFASATYDTLALGGINVYSSSTTVSASITGAGFLTAPSANFTSALQLGGGAVATQSYVTGLGYIKKFTGTVTGDAATTSFAITHSLGTRDVAVQVYQTSAGPDIQYATVEVDVVRTSTTVATIGFATAPASGTTYNVVITG